MVNTQLTYSFKLSPAKDNHQPAHQTLQSTPHTRHSQTHPLPPIQHQTQNTNTQKQHFILFASPLSEDKNDDQDEEPSAYAKQQAPKHNAITPTKSAANFTLPSILHKYQKEMETFLDYDKKMVEKACRNGPFKLQGPHLHRIEDSDQSDEDEFEWCMQKFKLMFKQQQQMSLTDRSKT